MLKPVEVRDDLTIAIGDTASRLSPAEGFRIAEDLIRKSARRALAEEVERGAEPSGSPADDR